MRKVKPIQVTETIVSEIKCDYCGKGGLLGLMKNSIKGAVVTFKFGLDTVRDGDCFNFDLCEDCANEVMNNIKGRKDNLAGR